MKRERLVVIGGVAAGTKAASKARRENPDWEVIVLTRDKDISYAGCGLPYFLSGVIKERKELVVRGPQEFQDEQDILVLTQREALSIDVAQKTVTFREVVTEQVHTIFYDHLILATGASPVLPPLVGIDLGNIYPLRTIEHAEAIRHLLETGEVQEAVVVGAGFVGLEAAENLALKGIKTTIVEMVPLVLPGYDGEMSQYVRKYLEEKGLNVLTGVKVQGFAGNSVGKVSGVKLEQEVIPAQLVIWAGGVRPNVDLARSLGLKLGPTGAIAVNEYQESSIPDIYAVGDCAENTQLQTGESVWFPMGSTSNKTGRIAGKNIGQETKNDALSGVLGTSVIKLFELHAGRTGLTEEQARAKGYKVVSVIVPANDRAHYYPGYQQIITKLIADQKSGKVLGVQVVGEGIVDKPVDIIATLISLGGTLEQLSRLDLAYAPPFSMAISSTILAAHVLINKIQGKFVGVNPSELGETLAQGHAVVLDVRTEVEHFIKAIPGSLNIPFNELVIRQQEIPRDKKLIVVCKVGKRAYLTLAKLQRLGFTDLAILEGGLEAYPYEVI